MKTMQDALRRAGVSAPDDSSSADTTTAAAPCGDHTGHLCRYLVSILGRRQATDLVADQISAPYGAARRAAAIEQSVRTSRGRLTQGKLREIESQCDGATEAAFACRRASDQEALLGDVHDALAGGGYDAWEASQRAAERRIASLQPPPPPFSVPAATWPVRLPTEVERAAYEAALETFADGLTEAEAARLGVRYPHHVAGAWYAACYDAVKAAATAHVAAAMAAATAAYEAGSCTLAGGAERVAAAERETHDVGRNITRAVTRARTAYYTGPEVPVEARLYAMDLASYTRRGWEEGYGAEGSPPQGWGALSTAAVARIAVGSVHAPTGAMADAELLRRFATPERPAVVVGGLAVLAARDPNPYAGWRGRAAPLRGWTWGGEPVAVATEPSTEGWVGGADHTPVWVPPEMWPVLERVRRHPGGCLDVRHVLGAYSRHPDKGYPRMVVGAYRRDSVLVGVDSALGPHLDDLAALAAAGAGRWIPDPAYRLYARATALTPSRLHLHAGPGPTGVLIALTGHERSRGRWGWAGDSVSLHPANQAVAASASGSSRGGGDRGTCVVGVVTVATPLLLACGAGWRVTHDGGVERVAGLAEVAP